MRRLLGIILAAFISTGAHAQTTARVGYAADGNGSQPFTYVSSLTPLPVSGSFSAGSFAPGGNYATLTSTASSADSALPTGTTVALFNTGTTAVSCILSIGAGSATASKNIIQSNSWFAVVPGSNTHYSCINQAGDGASNVVVASGGSGLPAGAGGGGSSLTGFATAANQATNTATTSHTCSTGGFSELGCLGQIDDDIKNPLAAGTNVIGGIFGSPNVTPTDCSTTITSGGTAQNIISAASTIHGFTIANIDTGHNAEPVWFSFTTTAAASTAASYPLSAPTATTFANLASYTTPLGFGSNHAVSVIAATTGHIISCTQW